MTALAKTMPEALKGAEGFLARYAGLRRRLPGDDTVREAAAELRSAPPACPGGATRRGNTPICAALPRRPSTSRCR